MSDDHLPGKTNVTGQTAIVTSIAQDPGPQEIRGKP